MPAKPSIIAGGYAWAPRQPCPIRVVPFPRGSARGTSLVFRPLGASVLTGKFVSSRHLTARSPGERCGLARHDAAGGDSASVAVG
jgi:hypothetical protein